MASRSLALVALVALGSVGTIGLLQCGGNPDPTPVGTTSAALLATARPSVPPVEGASLKPPGGAPGVTMADHFDLTGGDVHVVYHQVDGVPVFVYQDASRSTTFSGNAIYTETGPAGTMISVVLVQSVDAGYDSFTVLVPRVQVTNASMPVQTQGITIHHELSIAPVLGQLDWYTFTALEGTGSRPSVLDVPRAATVVNATYNQNTATPNN